MSARTLQGISIHDGSLILINPDHAYLEAGSVRPLSRVLPGSRVLMDARAAALLCALMERIGGWDHIIPVSGWRSMEEQKAIWDDSLKHNGLDFTKTYVAVPGHSEHQTGLAIDLGLRGDDIDFIRPSFPYTGVCGEFRTLAPEYGFVERYPAGKEAVTGIGHEPWHFRYVGVPHARLMTENHWTLEEYIALLHAYPFGSRPYRCRQGGRQLAVSYAAAGRACAPQPPCTISGNNVDGFLVTEWRESHGA